MRHAGTDPDTEHLAQQVIGAAIEVHRELGPGYLESVYEEALSIELQQRGIGHERQAPFAVLYKGHPVGAGRMDMLVEGRLVLELKTVDAVLPVHRAQVLSYLRATNLRLGLLLNFKAAVLKDGLERIINTARALERP